MPDPLPTSQSPKSLSPEKAILVGHLVITLPIGAIFVGLMQLAAAILPDARLLFVLVGFVVSLLWWSAAAPRWRKWALSRGAEPQRLQKLAVATGLLRRRSRFEKTEIRPGKKKG